jgi:hypothetical protein
MLVTLEEEPDVGAATSQARLAADTRPVSPVRSGTAPDRGELMGLEDRMRIVAGTGTNLVRPLRASEPNGSGHE